MAIHVRYEEMPHGFTKIIRFLQICEPPNPTDCFGLLALAMTVLYCAPRNDKVVFHCHTDSILLTQNYGITVIVCLAS